VVNTTDIKSLSVLSMFWRPLLATYLARSEPITSCFSHSCRRSTVLPVVLNSDHLVIVISLLLSFACRDVGPGIRGAIRLWSKLGRLCSTRGHPITLTGAHFLEENLLPEV